MMTDIDLTTGLPALKEGQFWRVRKCEPGWYDSLGQGYLVVELIERIEFEKRTRRTFLGIPLWLAPPVKVVDHATLAYQVIWDPDRPFVEKEYAGRLVTVDGKKYFPLSVESLTPSIILEAAKKALSWYEDKLASEKLLGDYPPKKLPDA